MRGIKLIEKAIDYLNTTNNCGIEPPMPVSKDIIEKLLFPGNLPLSPALKKFLEFDGWFLSEQFTLFNNLNNPEFEAITIEEAVREILGENYVEDFKNIPKPFPVTKIIVLSSGSESITALLLIKPDKNNEYPVIVIDVDDEPGIFLNACGIDIWIASEIGFIDDPSIVYEDDMAKMRKKLFGDGEEEFLYVSADNVNEKYDDPDFLSDQSYKLIQSGKVKEAHELLINHFINTGKFDVNSLNNLIYTINNYKLPDVNTINKIVEMAIKNLNENAGYLFPFFISNLTILLNNTGRQILSIEAIDAYKEKNGLMTCGLYCNYTYAATLTKDFKIIKEVLNNTTRTYNANPLTFTRDKISGYVVLGNMACLFALIGNKEKMLKFLKLTKKLHPDFIKMKTDSDFREYWEDKDFIELFN